MDEIKKTPEERKDTGESEKKSGTRRRKGRRGGKFDKRDRKPKSEMVSFATNDVSWYVKTSQIAKDVASLPFGRALGNTEDLGIGTASQFTIPGILVLPYIPTIGISRDGQSPANIGAQNLYSWVRHQNSGSSNYEKEDLMLTIMGVMDAYATIFEYGRALLFARTYSALNRYLAKSLIESMGYDYNDLITNATNIRAFLNIALVRLSAIPIPTTFDIFKRVIFMASNVFTDDPDIAKAQLYVPVRGAYRTYEEYSTGGGYLKTNYWGQGGISDLTFIPTLKRKFSDMAEVINTQVDKLLSSEDIGIMSGDILKAYKNNSLYTVGLFDENMSVSLNYSTEFLAQLHHLTAFLKFNATSMDITQNPSLTGNFIEFNPRVYTATYVDSANKIIDSDDAEVSTEWVVEATRCMAVCDYDSYRPTMVGGRYLCAATLITCGTEIYISPMLITSPGDNPVRFTVIPNYEAEYATYGVIDPGNGLLSQFDHFPIMIKSTSTEITETDGPVLQNIVVHAQLDNYTILPAGTLENLNRVAFLGLWNVPQSYGSSGSQTT